MREGSGRVPRAGGRDSVRAASTVEVGAASTYGPCQKGPSRAKYHAPASARVEAATRRAPVEPPKQVRGKVARMSRRAAWEKVWRRFDPEEPAIDPAWRADRPHSPVRRILKKLELPFGDGPMAMLLSGVTGSGKSTELLRVREAREGKDLVLFLDLLRHFRAIGDSDALQHVEAWEVVYQAGLAVLAAARELLPYPVPPDMIEGLRRAWERAAEATETPRPTELDLGKIASGMIAAGAVLLPLAGFPADTTAVAAASTGALRSLADGVRRIVPIGRSRKALPDQDEAMETVLGAVNLLIGHVQSHHRRIVLVIDGLDWIREDGRQLALFDRSELLGRLACPALVCAPYNLLSSAQARNLRRFDSFVLANEPVLDRERPEEPGPQASPSSSTSTGGGRLISGDPISSLSGSSSASPISPAGGRATSRSWCARSPSAHGPTTWRSPPRS